MMQQRTTSTRSLNAMLIMTIALILLNVLLTLKGLSPFQLLP